MKTFRKTLTTLDNGACSNRRDGGDEGPQLSIINELLTMTMYLYILFFNVFF